jgi:hypothetical protein
MPEETPRYKHDCKNCVFLGLYQENNTIYDLYVCAAGKNISTVVARYSSDGPDYFSGLEFASTNNALKETLKRAEERGYIR